MKYFIDTEFLEGKQDKRFLGIKYGKTKPTIDLISIGIVAEDGREYYAISKEFNLKEAWNRFDWKEHISLHKEDEGKKLVQKVYWIRENVLKPIWRKLFSKSDFCLSMSNLQTEAFEIAVADGLYDKYFAYKSIKSLINKYGKTNKQIAEEIIEFTYGFAVTGYPKENTNKIVPKDIQFYAYYADYDWVVFCWLFGKMMDLPNGFPKYCNDLVQELGNRVNKFKRNDFFTAWDIENAGLDELTLEEKLKHIKLHTRYPSQTNEHNALADAKWNKELYKFIKSL